MSRFVVICCAAITLLGCKTVPVRDLDLPLVANASLPMVEEDHLAFENQVHLDSFLPVAWNSYLPTPRLSSSRWDREIPIDSYGQWRAWVIAESTHISADYNSLWDRAIGQHEKSIYYHFKLNKAPQAKRVMPAYDWSFGIIP